MNLPIESRRGRKRRATHARILAAASELFASRGLTVTMEEIAAAADVAPATLFNYFPTRAAVLEGMAGDLFGAIAAGVAAQRLRRAPLGERLDAVADITQAAVADAHRRMPDLLRQLVQATALDNHGGAAMARLERVLSGFLYDGQQRGEVRDDVDAAFLAVTARAMLVAALLHWLDDPRYPLAARLRQASALIRDALRRRQTAQE